MKTISLTMIVKNEEKWLEQCLAAVKPYVDEIIIVDTGSSDKTKEIASSYTHLLYDFLWCDDFAAARNFALSKASCDWVLVLDADEIITHFPADLKSQFLYTDRLGTIAIKSDYLTKGTVRTSLSKIPRLFPRGFHFEGAIHEQVICPLPIAASGITVLHHGYEVSKAERNIPLLKRSLDQDSSNPYLHYQLAKEYYGNDELNSSLNHFESCYTNLTGKEPYFALAINAYLYALKDAAELDLAYTLIQKHGKRLALVPDFHFYCGLFYTDFVLSNFEQNAHLFGQIEGSYLEALKLFEAGYPSHVEGTGSYLAAYNLGIFYELTGQIAQAKHYYHSSASLGYEPAKQKNGL
jgi:glycosyltransferase involved in cell wall biosynthesis